VGVTGVFAPAVGVRGSRTSVKYIYIAKSCNLVQFLCSENGQLLTGVDPEGVDSVQELGGEGETPKASTSKDS